MKKLFLIVAGSILFAAPSMSHPRQPRMTWTYSYPEKDVMVRRDYKKCKKIKYITKYDKYGWYTERKVLPLKSCWRNGHSRRSKIEYNFWIN